MTTEYGITLTLNPRGSGTGNTIDVADEMLSSYEILSGKNQPFPRAIVKFDRSLYESESSWDGGTIPDVVDGQSRLSIIMGPYGYFYNYVIAKHTTSDRYVSFECYDVAYLLKTTELGEILLPGLRTGYLDARTPLHVNCVELLNIVTYDYIFIPSSSLKVIDSTKYLYSADMYISLEIRRGNTVTSGSHTYTHCKMQGTVVISDSYPHSGIQYIIQSIDRFQGDLASLFRLCCNYVAHNCFVYHNPPTITIDSTNPNNWLLNETVNWSATSPTGYYETRTPIATLYSTSSAGLTSNGTYSEKEQYYGHLVLTSPTSSRYQYTVVTAENVDQLVTVNETVAYSVVNDSDLSFSFDIRTNEFASSVLSSISESYNMAYFFFSEYNDRTRCRSDGYLLPKNPFTGITTTSNILYSNSPPQVNAGTTYIISNITGSLGTSRTITLDYNESSVDFLTAPQISNQGTGDLVTSVTVASENYQGSISYLDAPFSGKNNKIYIPYVDQDNEKGTIAEIKDKLTYAKKFVKRAAYNILRANKLDQNMCSYSTQELVPKIISVESLPTTDIDTYAVYAIFNPNTMGETCYMYSGTTWTTVTPTLNYWNKFPYEFATIVDGFNGKTLTKVPLAAVRTQYPECITTWLWGYPPYLDIESSVNDLTKSALVSAEQGTENITISENYAARIIVGDSDPDELPPSDPSTGNRLYDPTNQSLGGFTGLIQERNEDTGIYRLAGYDNGIMQAQFRTDGKITTGGDSVQLDADGLTVLYDPSDTQYNKRDSLKYVDKNTSTQESPTVPFRMYYLSNKSILDAQDPATNLSLRFKEGAVVMTPIKDSVSIDGATANSTIYNTGTKVFSSDTGTAIGDLFAWESGAGSVSLDFYGYSYEVAQNYRKQYVEGTNYMSYQISTTNTTPRVDTNGTTYSGTWTSLIKGKQTGLWGCNILMDSYIPQNKTFVAPTGETVTGTFIACSLAFTIDLTVTQNVAGTIYIRDDGGNVISAVSFSALNPDPRGVVTYQGIPFPQVNLNETFYSIDVAIESIDSPGGTGEGIISNIRMNLQSVAVAYTYRYAVPGSESYTRISTTASGDTVTGWRLTSDPTRILKITNINLNTWQKMFVATRTENNSFADPIYFTEPTAFYTDAAGKELIIGVSSPTAIANDVIATCDVQYNSYTGVSGDTALGGQVSVEDTGVTLYGKTTFMGDIVQTSNTNARGSAVFDSDVFYVKSNITEVNSPIALATGSLRVSRGITSPNGLEVAGPTHLNGTLAGISGDMVNGLRSALHPQGSNYAYLTGNIVIAWGVVSNDSGAKEIWFPVSFSSAPGISVTKISNDDDTGGNDWVCVVTNFYTSNGRYTGARLSVPDDSSEQSSWIVIGFV